MLCRGAEHDAHALKTSDCGSGAVGPVDPHRAASVDVVLDVSTLTTKLED